ncbi:DUF4231 domain-containing protein [Oscillatoria sp. CS-180]|uniref:DUF4231 domain-containing protein n=1 Tax=Oscillatoria sp. CS-180 TaxID=3021720 RepID=UPI00232C26CF|nr:DUF4231 domain-containing protein [Oscillatoria sp. CS-180]MDB9528403.1 DUF4231 domain-containing protein [Oscillatoria sp. CS-180]
MAKTDPYAEFLKEDFQDLFSQLELTDVQRKFLGSRWLDQVLWMEKKANHCRDRHYRLRLTAIVLGVIVPVLIGVSTGNERADKVKEYVTIGLSAVVAVSAAVEEFFHYGERWYHYRRTVESLKTYGWQFSQLSGPYAKFPTHKDAFMIFANQVEEVIQRDVEVYVTQVAKTEDDSAQQPTPALPSLGHDADDDHE